MKKRKYHYVRVEKKDMELLNAIKKETGASLRKLLSNALKLFYKKNEEYLLNVNGNRGCMGIFHGAKQRCNNPKTIAYKTYGGRGIKFKLTKEDIIKLWKRDRAYSLSQPSLDRIDNDGNYEFSNCRFIENSENSSKGNRKEKTIKITPDPLKPYPKCRDLCWVSFREDIDLCHMFCPNKTKDIKQYHKTKGVKCK